MAPIVITESELLDAVRAAALAGDEGPPGAMTAKELRAALGFSRWKVQAALGKLREQGRLGAHRVRRADANGRLQVVTAYTIAPEPKAKPKR